ARGLCGRTLGVLGFGSIGRAVAERASGLGMRVIAWSRSLSAGNAPAGIEIVDSPIALAKASDAVTLHLAFAKGTKHIVNREFLAAMRPGTILVNTARGELVDTSALRDAIEEKKLRVGLDVFEDEPAGGKAKFSATDLAAVTTATPHIGASTNEASEAIAAEVVRIISVFQQTGRPPVAVNLCERGEAKCNLVVRHLNRVGVLAGLLDGLRREDINVEEMDNVIFAGGEAACCTLLLSKSPSPQFVDTLGQDASILYSAIREL
ncbi:MAG: NAD(P)-dependent oxidoreductase, partial [Pirellulales bacterium]|nr:NAD(P)-dependent oxidoreductase [Pirellulales bacterium]